MFTGEGLKNGIKLNSNPLGVESDLLTHEDGSIFDVKLKRRT